MNNTLFTFQATTGGSGSSGAGAGNPEKIVWVSAGFSHSALVSREGLLWTFGKGDQGQLGGGDFVASRRTPEVVMALTGVRIGMVSCGATHTVRNRLLHCHIKTMQQTAIIDSWTVLVQRNKRQLLPCPLLSALKMS